MSPYARIAAWILGGAALALCLFLAGCVNGIPDADPPVPKVKACEVRVRMDGHETCMTREEFNRAMKGILL